VKHFVIVSVLVVIVTLLVILGLNAIELTPQLASEEGALVDQMFQWQVYVISFIFALIMVIVLYSVVVFRRRPGETGEGAYVKGSVPLESAWTLIPLIVVMGFGAMGALHLSEMTAVEADELVVEVTGFQFGWRFDYPDHGVTSSDLYLPLGRPVRFKLTSTDVIHSFWVPEFRIKQDAVPGMWTTLRVTPSEPATFRIRCAEICGYAHSAMFADVLVVEPEDFDAWLAGQEMEAEAPDDLTPTELGAKLSEEQGCLSCHTLDGSTLVGASWLGLFGSERELEDGTVIVADEEYIRDSILDPDSQVVAGFPKVMPPAYTMLSDADVDAIVEYIKTLSD
jgi:cytochrome c oxidase subunit 2